MSFGSGAQLNLTGSNLTELEEAAETLREAFSSIDGVATVSTSLSDGSPRAELEVDRWRRPPIGTTPSAVLSTVQSILSGQDAGSIQDGDQEYSITVTYPEDRFSDVSDLSGLMITTSGGGQVPLTDIAEIRFTNSPSQIQRSDGEYQASVSADLDSGCLLHRSFQPDDDHRPANQPPRKRGTGGGRHHGLHEPGVLLHL